MSAGFPYSVYLAMCMVVRGRRLRMACVIIALLATLVPVAHAAGKVTKHEIKVGDTVRKYMVYRPTSVPRTSPAKAVFAFHGFMSDPAGLRWLTKPDKWADKHKYLMIYPAALKGSFNAGKGSGTSTSGVDELAFFDALVRRAVDLHKVDRTRLYAIGFSNGAQMAALAMCKRGKSLAGIAMVAHSLNISGCKPAVPVPTVIIRGAKDPFVPFAGGGRFGLKSHVNTVKAMQGYLKLNVDKNEVSLNLPSMRCRDYPSKSKSRLRTCVGFNDGHTWPGGTKFQSEKFGQTNKEINGYQLILPFFDRQKAASPPLAKTLTTGKKPTKSAKQRIAKAKSKTKAKAKPQSLGKTGSSRKKVSDPVSAPALRQATRGQFSIPIDPTTGEPVE